MPGPGVRTFLSITLFFLAAAPAMAQQSPGPQGPEEGSARRQLWLVPIPGERLLMRAQVLRPPGPGPFPLVVINHGSSQSSYERGTYRPSQYRLMSQWFLDRGYAVVLPLRPGHGETAGPYFEDQGRCEDPNYERAGLGAADSIQAAVDYMSKQSFAKPVGAIVVGQSAGGWGALALASRNPPSVAAVINLSGGRGGRADDRSNTNCMPERLVATAATFGRMARIPTLWIYAENDSYFAPVLAKQMYEAFRGAGGRGDFHLLALAGGEGHVFIESTEALPIWAPIVEAFLAKQR